MDSEDDIFDLDTDLTPYYDQPPVTPEEMEAIAHLLPPNFGRPKPSKTRNPAPASLTTFTEKISIRIPRPILALIKEQATQRGLPYQTYINMMLSEGAVAGHLSGG